METAEANARTILLADDIAAVAPLLRQRHAGIAGAAVVGGAAAAAPLLPPSLWPPAGQVAAIFDRLRGRLAYPPRQPFRIDTATL